MAINRKLFTIFTTLILTGFVTSSSSPVHYNINSALDKILEELAKYLISNNFYETVLPDFGFSAAPVFIDVSLTNLSTVHRTGDCEIWSEDGNLKIKMTVGLTDMKVNVALFPATQGPATLEINGGNFEIGVSLYPDDKKTCQVLWDSIDIKTLGSTTLFSNLQDYNDKELPKVMLDEMISYYNKYLNNNDIVNIKFVSKYVELCNFKEMIDVFEKYKQ